MTENQTPKSSKNKDENSKILEGVAQENFSTFFEEQQKRAGIALDALFHKTDSISITWEIKQAIKNGLKEKGIAEGEEYFYKYLYPFFRGVEKSTNAKITAQERVAAIAELCAADSCIEAAENAMKNELEQQGHPISPWNPDDHEWLRKSILEIARNIKKGAEKRAAPFAHVELSRAEKIRLTNTPVDNWLGKDPKIGEKMSLRVGKDIKREKDVFIYALLDIDPQRITGPVNFTLRDQFVLDTIHSTCYEAWIRGEKTCNVTLATLAKDTWGTDDKPGPSQLKIIEESIEKMAAMRVTINLRDQIQNQPHRGFFDPRLFPQGTMQTTAIKGNIITAAQYQGEAGGQIITYYSISLEPDFMPILLRYALAVGQFILADPEVLKIKDVKDGKILGSRVQLTEDRLIIRNRLFRRIAIMQHPASQNQNRIKLQRLYDALEIAPKDRTKRKRTNDFIKSCLEYWKAFYKENGNAWGVITDYKINYAGRSLDSIDIYTEPMQPLNMDRAAEPVPATPKKRARKKETVK